METFLSPKAKMTNHLPTHTMPRGYLWEGKGGGCVCVEGGGGGCGDAFGFGLYIILIHLFLHHCIIM